MEQLRVKNFRSIEDIFLETLEACFMLILLKSKKDIQTF